MRAAARRVGGDNVKSTKSVSPATTMTATRSGDRPTSPAPASALLSLPSASATEPPPPPPPLHFLLSPPLPRLLRKNSLRFLLQVFFAFRGFSSACLLCNQIVATVKFQRFCNDAMRYGFVDPDGQRTETCSVECRMKKNHWSYHWIFIKMLLTSQR